MPDTSIAVKHHRSTRRLLLLTLMLFCSLWLSGCQATAPVETPYPDKKLDPLTSVTLTIDRIILHKGALIISLHGTIVDPRSFHVAAGKTTEYDSTKVYLRVLDRQGGADVYALDTKPVPWMSLTDDPEHSSFKLISPNVFETDAATFAGTDHLYFYPDGKEFDSVAINEKTFVRFLDNGYLQVQTPKPLLGTSTDMIALKDIDKVSFNRDVHISDVTIDHRDIATSSINTLMIGLPNGGGDLRQQCNRLEGALKKANVRCEEHYVDGTAGAFIFPGILIVGAVGSGIITAIQFKRKKDGWGCLGVGITVILGIVAAFFLFIALAFAASDPSLTSFLGEAHR